MKYMTWLKYLLTGILLLCLHFNLSAQHAWAGPNIVRMALTSEGFSNINQNDALAALKAWGDAIIREQNLSLTMDARFFTDKQDLYAAYRKGGVDAFTASVEDCLRLGVTPDQIYVVGREDGHEIRYALIVKRNRNIRNISDLKSQQLVLFDGNGMNMARLWLKTLWQGPVEDAAVQEPNNHTVIDSPSKAIMQVFFQQADAAVVTKEAFDLACELNPQLGNELTVLAESPPLVTHFFLFREDWQGTQRDAMDEAIQLLHTTPGGRQILTVYQGSHMAKLPGSVLDGTRRFLLLNSHLLDDFPETAGQP